MGAPICTVEANALGDPAGFDIVLNATSLGVNGGDPLPVDVSRISQAALVVEVVAVPPRTRLLEAATARGLAVVPGMAMMTPQLELVAEYNRSTPDSGLLSLLRQHLYAVS